MAAEEAKTADAEAPAPPSIIYATNPEPTVAHGAAKDVTDCDYGRLLLRRWGVPKSRFIGNMLVLYKSSSGKPRLMLGPYWTMLLGVTVPLSIIMPALICAFLLSTKVHVGVQIAYGVIVLWTACALASVSLRNPGLVERRDSIPMRENGKPELAWVWNDQARTCVEINRCRMHPAILHEVLSRRSVRDPTATPSSWRRVDGVEAMIEPWRRRAATI